VKFTRSVEVGNALVQAVHLQSLIHAVMDMIRDNPLALLCGRPDCERCEAVRWG
jgi:hypothetical protein